MRATLSDQPSGGRTGGVYVPPFKLAQMLKQQAQQDTASAESQKRSWEALRKSLNGLINKVNVSNIKNIVPEMFEENLIRGRGLFARAIMKAQLASPGFTHIYASLVAVINTKLPENGELILKRVIIGFKRAYKRRDKNTAIALAKFIAHLVNHQVAHELLALQVLTVLLEEPTDDSVEIAVGFVKEVGQLLEELSPQGLHAIFERFRGILHEGDIDKRVQYTIEGLFATRKSGFKDYPAIPKELDLVEREDQITFETGLDDDTLDKEEMLDVFRVDGAFEDNEKLWEQIRKEMLGDDDDEDEDATDGDDEGEDEPAAAGGGESQVALRAGEQQAVVDLTEQDLVNLRRTIYLTIMSSVSFEECCHKLVKLKIPDGYESELCNMLVECCSNERSFLRYYGLMGQRFCMMHRKYQDAFDQVFLSQYSTIHRLETNKLRNVAKFCAHLLAGDALPWTCFEYIKLNEYDTTSSSRIFVKILVQDLAEQMGLATLKERFSDPYMQDVFGGLFPTDNARNTRFAINFFTSIGLGGLTDGLREHLKNAPKLLALQMQAQLLEQEKQKRLTAAAKSSSSSSSSDSSSSGSSSDSSSSNDSDSSSSDSDSSSSSASSSSGSARRKKSSPPKRGAPSRRSPSPVAAPAETKRARRSNSREVAKQQQQKPPKNRQSSRDRRSPSERARRERSSSGDNFVPLGKFVADHHLTEAPPREDRQSVYIGEAKPVRHTENVVRSDRGERDNHQDRRASERERERPINRTSDRDSHRDERTENRDRQRDSSRNRGDLKRERGRERSDSRQRARDPPPRRDRGGERSRSRDERRQRSPPRDERNKRRRELSPER